MRSTLPGPALIPARRPPRADLGLASLSAADRPGRPAGDPASAGGTGPAPGRDPGRGHDHHPQAGRLSRLPRPAAELGLLAANPLDRITWRPPRSSCSADPRSAPTPAEVQAILAEVTQIRPELTAFFGCLYYAALRPAEAVALRATSCALPPRGWGQLTLTASLPRSARAWTGNGTPREPRSLKHRPEGAIRTVPIPRSLPASCAGTCGPSGAPKMGGCSRVPAAARSAKASMAGSGNRPVPRPAQARQAPRRHAAPTTFAMPRCRCGLPPAPRPLKSLPAPGTACMYCSPSTPTAYPAATRSPASTSSRPSARARGPQLAHQNAGTPREFRPSCVRATAGLNGTQLDLKPPPRSGYTSMTCGNAQTGRSAHRSRPRAGGPGRPFFLSRWPGRCVPP